MATKVRSIPSNYTRISIVNNASGLDNLELSNESPRKYGFDIGILNDFDLNSDKQHSDKSFKIKDNNSEASGNFISSSLSYSIPDEEINVLDFLQGVEVQAGNTATACLKLKSENSVSMAPTINCENTLVSVSLSALAENHLKSDKNPQVSNDLCSDSDSTLTDLLSDIAATSVCSKKSNFFGLSFSPRNDYFLNKCKAEPVSDVIDDDLTVLLDSCNNHHLQPSSSSNINSLNNLSNNFSDNFREINSKHVTDCKINDNSNFDLSESLEDILSDGNVHSKISNPVTSLSDNFKCVNKVNGSSEKCDIVDKKSPTIDSDDEIMPDIDLNFCIKKSKNKKVTSSSFTGDKSSPQSTDSGFDETVFDSAKSSLSFQDFYSYENAYLSEKDFKSVLTNPKPSLLSKAISCKPKSDKTRSERVKNIKRGLLKKYFPMSFTDCNQQNMPRMFDRIEDQSTQCIIKTNGYIKVPDQ